MIKRGILQSDFKTELIEIQNQFHLVSKLYRVYTIRDVVRVIGVSEKDLIYQSVQLGLILKLKDIPEHVKPKRLPVRKNLIILKQLFKQSIDCYYLERFK